MMYSSEEAKWKAYQFSDPFASNSFFVCNKISKIFCRPDCDVKPKTNLKSEIKFVDHSENALEIGFRACSHCDPLSRPAINVQMLVDCVAHINKDIGFLTPLLDENEEKNNEKIKENIMESKKANEKQILQAIGGRRSSVPVINFDGQFSKDFENSTLSKNDFDHYKLVDLACRHLAFAAAVNILNPLPYSKQEDISNESSKKRRRRGGVLGFKELAAKSKLSAWHFHRVFKSVTGLTPKTYGDKCWEFIEKYKNSSKYSDFANANTNLYQNRGSPMQASSSIHTPLSISRDSSISAPTSPDEGPALKKIKTNNRLMVSQDANNTWDSKEGSEENSLIKDNLLLKELSENQPMDTIPESIIDDTLDLNNKASGFAVPQLQTFDMPLTQNPLETNNWGMFDELTNDDTYAPSLFGSFHSRAFSAPDLTSYHSRKGATLFNHMKPKMQDVQEISTDTPEAGIQDQSPLMNIAEPQYGNLMSTLQDEKGTLQIDDLFALPIQEDTTRNNISESDFQTTTNYELDTINPLSTGLPSELLTSSTYGI